MPQFSVLLIIYFFIICTVAVVVTVADKKESKKKGKKRRISESSLLFIGFIGGALPMYVTMKLIRHKTRHKKFMIGLPVEFVLHIILLLWYIF